jgi:hypothetical protein
VLAPGDAVSVQWDNWGNENSNFTLEFSSDDGQNWQTISSSIPPGSESFDWVVPSFATNEARLRLIRSDDGKFSSPGPFRICGVPAMQLSASQCPGSIAIEWSAVAGATDYEVMCYRNGDMIAVATTAATNYYFGNLSEDSTYWITVRARNNGLAGRRAVAFSRKPDNGNCAAAIHDHDLKADALIYPLVGRQFTSMQISNEAIRVRIKNFDDAADSGFMVSYCVNGNAWVNEMVNTPIAAVSVVEYSFQTKFDFTAVGSYTIKLAVTDIDDQNRLNDTVTYLVRNLPNEPLNLFTVASEDLESASTRDYTTSYIGLKSLDRFDYEKSSPASSLRVGSDYLQNPTKSFELVNVQGYPGPDQSQSLTATYNLSLFDTAQQSAALDFSYTHVNNSISFDSLLVRGSDSNPWIPIQNLFPGGFQAVSKDYRSIPLSSYLKANHQNFSSSFQIRWSISSYSGMLLDNIKLYNSTNDVGLLSIDSIQPYSCGFSFPIRITVWNQNKSIIQSLPVHYRIDNGPVVSDIMSSTLASDSIIYRFAKSAEVSTTGIHTIVAWIDNAQDGYRNNDTVAMSFYNQPLIKTFPHIEDLEENNGGWFVGGQNSSWEYGTPASPRISEAASGTKAWKTNLDGNYNTSEFSWLYFGCYDFSQLKKPVISMSVALNTDSCGLPSICDALWLQYSLNGKDWNYMSTNSIYNWPVILASVNYNRWHVASRRVLDTAATIQFRFQFRSDDFNTYEGIGIDDLHVYDSTTTIYEGNGADVKQTINGGQEWIEFKKDGKLIGAIQPNGQNLGDVQLKTFINSGEERHFHGQYYSNRSFVFKPANPLSDSVIVRLYFTDSDADSLLFAKACRSCTTPKNAYRFGISSYKTDDATELDSSILNNRKGEWNFIANSKVKTAPFMNGYYLEFKTKDANEFRLSNGGLDGKSDLPVQLETFSAERFLSAVNVQWRTAAEINIDHFDIEVANGNDAFQLDHFEKIGQVFSKGRSVLPQSYSYMDTMRKSGVCYYRLKNVDVFGNYSYSKPVPVLFNEELTWQVFPNPGSGKYNLIYQSTAGDIIQIRVVNVLGQFIKELELIANGFVQKGEIDLSASKIASGIYILRIRTQQKSHFLRVVKQ